MLVFVIPFLSLWIATELYFPYITGRNFAFRLLIGLAFVLWIALAVLDKNYRPRFTPMFWVLTVFVAIVGIADAFGVDPFHSFWSRFERMEGYIMILHLYVYFLVITNIFKSKKEWFKFFSSFVAAGVLVGGYGILQILGVKEALQGGGVRIDGTIGNPTYYAVYITLISALALILLFNTHKKWLKYALGSAVILNLFLLYFTASRGAALALLISIPLFLVLYLGLVKSRTKEERLTKKIMLGALAVVILAPIVFLSIKDSQFVKNNSILSRFATISLEQRTIRARLMIWNMSLKGFLERPILGWGQENFMRVFAKYFDPGLYDQEPWFDRPHNIVFEWLINAGILGLLAYVSLFAVFYWLLIRAWRADKINVKEGIVLFVVPIAYFIQNFFVFDNFNTYIIFFALLGYVGSIKSLDKTSESAALYDKANLSLIVLAVVLVVFAITSYFITIKPWKAAAGIIDGLKATQSGADAFSKTKAAFERTLGYKTFGEREALEQLSRVTTSLLSRSVPKSIKKDFVEFTAPKLENYLSRFPDDIRVHLFAGQMYNVAGAAVDPKYWIDSRRHLQKAHELSPTKQPILYALAENYLRSNEVNKAFELLDKAIELEPSNIEAYEQKAVFAIVLGRNDIVMEMIKAMNNVLTSASKERKPHQMNRFNDAMLRLGNLYRQLGQDQNARAIYEYLIKMHPENKYFQELLQNVQ